MIHRCRRATALLMAVGCVCLLAACGSSSSSGSSTTAGSSGRSGRGGGVFASLTSTQRSCLSKHGLKFAAGTGRRPSGSFPKGKHADFNGTPAKGKFPKGRFPRGRRPSFGHGGAGGAGGFGGADSSSFEKAFKACKVTLPSFRRPSGAGGAPSGATATSGA